MNTSIAQRRKEMKSALAEGNNKTLIDTFLGWLSRGKPLPSWLAIVVIFLLTSILAIIVIILSGEFSGLYNVRNSFSPGWLSWIFFTLFMCSASMIMGNVFFHRIVKLLREEVIDIVSSHGTLDFIQFWVASLTKKQLLNVILVLLTGFFAAVYVIGVLGSLAGLPTGMGLIAALALFSIQSSTFVGIELSILVLAFNLRTFELNLFEADPASSEIISALSSLFISFIYLVSIYGAIETFALVQTGLVAYSIPILLLFWIPILAIFVLSQLGLSQIIQRAKWKTLNAIQQKITALQKQSGLPPKDNRETLLWLLDYHERVKAMRNSALDLSASVNFLNSMLLPLIAFIIGNIDTIIKLLSGKP